jgi:hypothetical protein
MDIFDKQEKALDNLINIINGNEYDINLLSRQDMTGYYLIHQFNIHSIMVFDNPKKQVIYDYIINNKIYDVTDIKFLKEDENSSDKVLANFRIFLHKQTTYRTIKYLLNTSQYNLCLKKMEEWDFSVHQFIEVFATLGLSYKINDNFFNFLELCFTKYSNKLTPKLQKRLIDKLTDGNHNQIAYWLLNRFKWKTEGKQFASRIFLKIEALTFFEVKKIEQTKQIDNILIYIIDEYQLKFVKDIILIAMQNSLDFNISRFDNELIEKMVLLYSKPSDYNVLDAGLTSLIFSKVSNAKLIQWQLKNNI